MKPAPSRIYQKDIKATSAYVEDFTELGKKLNEPVKHYSSGMIAKLAFALTLSIDFDCLLIDEVLSVGDENLEKNVKKKY